MLQTSAVRTAMALLAPRWRTAAVVAVLGLWQATPARAIETDNLPGDFTIASWGLDDGLPSLRVWSIAEDAEGYLWLGTDDGLVRFDGVRFRRWMPVSGRPIQKGAVLKVFSADDGSIWVGQGPAGDGVSRIVNGRVENYGRAGLADAGITLLLEDRSGTMWTGNDDGLFELRQNQWSRLTPAEGVPRAAVYGGFRDRRGDLWIATSKGILRRPQGTRRFAVVDSSRQSVQGFAEDSAGTIWVTDPVAGFRALAEPEPSRPRLPASGNQVLHDSRGDLWVATLGRGLWRVRFDGGRLAIAATTAAARWPSDLLRALHEDRDGNIWVAADSGLYRFTPRKVTALTDVGRSRFVAATLDGAAWVGTAAGLLRVRDASTKSYGPTEGLAESGITALAADRSGTLWVATSREVSRLAGGRLVRVDLPEPPRLSNIRSLGAASDGVLWIYDNDEGLFEWREHRLVPFVPPAEIRGRRVRCLFVDRNDRAWISFTGGNVLVVTPDGRSELHRVLDEHGLINTIYEDRDGKIWLGGIHGLSRFDNGRIATVPQAKLPGYAVFSVVEDIDRNLWLGSALGIARLSQKEFDAAISNPAYQPHYEMFDASDGLAGMPAWFGVPNAIESAGRLWFVTTGGITVIDPARRDPRPVLPKVRIDNVTANGRPVPIDGEIAFPPDVRNLVFEYTVPNLTSPAKVTFRHRLTNVDTRWIDTGTRRDVSYANLAPGSYSFDVMAVSSDHGWNESAASWRFSIEPMFYQAGWFYSVCALTIVVMAWVVWRLRMRQLRRQFSLVLAERARMSREIHDTLLQGMVGVALQFDMLKETVGPVSPSLVDHLIHMRKQVEEYIRETRETIFDLRVSRSERDLAELLREAGARVTAGSDVQFNVAVSGSARPAGITVDRQLLQVAREAITNAVRHSRAHRIQVKVEYRSDSVLLRVSDDGHGFDVERATRLANGHFGLQTMRERAQQVGGKVRITSSIGMGTDIEIAVPLPADI